MPQRWVKAARSSLIWRDFQLGLPAMAIWTEARNDPVWETLSSPLEIQHPSLGEAVRFLRRTAAMTQEEVSARSGIHVTRISNMEQGKANPTHKVMRSLARGLDVPPAYISTLEDIFERQRKREAQDA